MGIKREEPNEGQWARIAPVLPCKTSDPVAWGHISACS